MENLIFFYFIIGLKMKIHFDDFFNVHAVMKKKSLKQISLRHSLTFISKKLVDIPYLMS